MAKSTRNVVSFELPPPVLQALQEDSEARGAVSHHKRAREIVIDALSSRELSELRESVTELESEVSYLGELVRRLAYSVIVHAGDKSSKEANEWIREHMPRNRPS